METVQLGARIKAGLVVRLDVSAAKTSRNRTQLVETCIQEFLPVLESGVFGTPIWDRLRERWAQDLEEVRRDMASVAGGVRSSPGATAAKVRKAA